MKTWRVKVSEEQDSVKVVALSQQPTTGVSRWAKLPRRSSLRRSQSATGALAAAAGAETGKLLQPLVYASGWLKDPILTLGNPVVKKGQS